MVGIEASAKQSIAGKKLGVLFVFKLLLNYDLNVVLNYVRYFVTKDELIIAKHVWKSDPWQWGYNQDNAVQKGQENDVWCLV